MNTKDKNTTFRNKLGFENRATNSLFWSKKLKTASSKWDWLWLTSAFFAGLTILAMVMVVVFIVVFSIPLFRNQNFATFFGSNWEPKNESYGIANFLISTFWTILFTMILVVVFNIFMAVFISKFLPYRIKRAVLFFFQVLSGVPSVLFGMFGAFVLIDLFQQIGIKETKSMMAVILVLTIMVLPTTIVLTVNILDNVPSEYEFASYALGVNKVETIFEIVRKFFSRKILLVLFYGFCRSIGEVTAITLIAGNGPNAPPLDEGFVEFFFHAITTLASLIGMEMAETFDDTHEGALYAVGLLLLLLVFVMNLLLFAYLKIKLSRGVSRLKFLFHQKSSQFDTPQWQQNLIIGYVQIKRFFQKFMMGFTFLAAGGLFSWIVIDIFINGIRHFDFSSLVTIEGETALLSVILATIILVIGSVIVSFPFAFFVAIFISEYNQKYRWMRKIANNLYFFVRQLSSSPTIIFGMFGFSVFVVFFGFGFSIFTASLTMILIVLPIMIQTLVQNLKAVPNYYRYSAEALGVPKRIIILKLIIPYIFNGLIISIILAVNKVISESAPIILTMGTTVAFPQRGIFSSGRSLSTHIYLLQNENLSVATEAITYQTALITFLFIFILNLVIYTLNTKKTKKR